MSAVISIFVSLPITVSVLAALFSQRVIIESIRSLSSTFFGIELSKHHKLLDGVLVNLDEIVFLSQDGKVSMPKFKESIYMVSHAIETISDELGIDPRKI